MADNFNTNSKNKTTQNFIELSGSSFFRIKIAYSLLFQKPIKITKIRTNDINPGLSQYEVSFLKLIETITNGTLIELSKTGTVLKFTPGVITNNYGDMIEFPCDNSRCLTYYLEGIVPIAMYGKESLNITLTGVTNDTNDISVDTFKSVTAALIQKMVLGDKVEFEIKRRGMFPLGNGCVRFRCPIVTFLNCFDWIDEGKIKRVRGTAFTSRVPGIIATRMIDSTRGVFNNFLPDVWIGVDNFKSKNQEEL